MGSKIWTVVNWGILVVVTIVAVWLVWGSPVTQPAGGGGVTPLTECIDIGKLDEFGYEACYDAYSEMIFLKVSRGKENYEINKLDVSFVDLVSKTYPLEEIPRAGKELAYKFEAQKNPKTIDIRLDVPRNFSGQICGSEEVFVDFCPAGTGGEGVDISISPIQGIGMKDFIEVSDFPDFYSDIIVMDLVEKESIWESTCKSNWDCGEWEACEDDISHRTCKDSNNCMIPTSSPISAQRCDDSCFENWECEWASCEDGFSVPKCNDLNGCGTSYSLPNELPCEERGKCSPNVVCGDWTDCDVDYDFVDLVGINKLTQLEGSKNRLCVDKKGCVATTKEEAVCSISVDIYTKRFEKCGDNYVGVYNVLDDSTLAVLKEGRGEKSYLNIYFDDQSGVYCDYCFDGVKNGDEDDVDCGGSCKECDGRVLKERHWWEFIFG